MKKDHHFVVCIQNSGYEASLELFKIYRAIPDTKPESHGYLRVVDEDTTWRILYHLAEDAVVILEVFEKETRTTPKRVLDSARARLKRYLRDVED